MTENSVDIFDLFFKSRAENIHTCLPGKIDIYDSIQRKATVKPLIKLKTKNGSDVEIPAISEVPVMFPSGSNFSLLWNIKKGDNCLLLFAETGIGNFLNSVGQVVNADDVSRFSLTDAICVPGLFPFSVVPSSDVTIESTVNNKLKISNKVENLKSVLTAFANAVKSIVTTGGYSLNPDSQLAIQEIITRIDILLE